MRRIPAMWLFNLFLAACFLALLYLLVQSGRWGL